MISDCNLIHWSKEYVNGRLNGGPHGSWSRPRELVGQGHGKTSAGKDHMLRVQQADGSVESHRRHSMQHAEQGRHPSNDEELLARATAINQSHSSDVIDVTK